MLDEQQQIFEQIKKANNILITFSRSWNGDAVASALAFYLFLKKMDKNVEIVADNNMHGEVYNFLPGYGQIGRRLDNVRKFVVTLNTANTKVDKVKYTSEENAINFIITAKEGFFTQDDVKLYPGDFKYDLTLVFDSPDLESLGSIYENNTEYFYAVPIINFDHNADNEQYGQINKVELTAVSTSEVLFNLMSAYSRDMIDEDVGTCLLAGIIAETRSFKTQFITPSALSVSAQLISMGARREEIVNKLFRSRSLNVLKLWGRVLARLTSGLDGKLVWTMLAASDFEKTGTTENDLSDVIDELIINIPEAKIIIIIYETVEKEGTEQKISTKAMVYSVKNINALDLVKDWNPVGTKNMAKIVIPKNLTEAEVIISETIKNNLGKLPL